MAWVTVPTKILASKIVKNWKQKHPHEETIKYRRNFQFYESFYEKRPAEDLNPKSPHSHSLLFLTQAWCQILLPVSQQLLLARNKHLCWSSRIFGTPVCRTYTRLWTKRGKQELLHDKHWVPGILLTLESKCNGWYLLVMWQVKTCAPMQSCISIGSLVYFNKRRLLAK